MTKDENSALAATLDFYSDKADAHASFFIATLLGLFTVLAIAAIPETPNRDLWAIPYWLLFYSGLYTLGNFSYYSTHARMIQNKLENDTIKNIEKDTRKGYILWFLENKRLIVHKKAHLNLPVLIVLVYSTIATFSCWLVFSCVAKLASTVILICIYCLLIIHYRWWRAKKEKVKNS